GQEDLALVQVVQPVRSGNVHCPARQHQRAAKTKEGRRIGELSRDLRRRRGRAQGQGGGIVVHGGVGRGRRGPGSGAVRVLEGNGDLLASSAEDRGGDGARRSVILCSGHVRSVR